MRIGSLFTGYGGLDMAAEAVLGGTVAWTVENDQHACKVIEARYPGVPNLGDVTRVDWAAVEPVDVVTAGYPCQPFSVAGQRRGTDDERHLWPYVAAAVRVLRPRWVLLENVAGHLRLGFADVLADLAGLRLDAEWTIVRASDVGAPHRRERLFCLAWDADREDAAPLGEVQEQESDADRAGGAAADSERQGWARPSLGSMVVAEERAVTLLPTPTAVDMGSGKTVQEWDDWTEAMRERHGNGNGHGDSLEVEALRLLPTPNASDGPHGGPGMRNGRGVADALPGINAFGPYQAAIGRWGQALGRPAPPPTQSGKDGRPRLSPRFVEWMMGLPEDRVTGLDLSVSMELKILGNGVVPQQAAHALQILIGRAAA